MKLLIINPNTTALLTDKIAGIARAFAGPGTEIIGATAPFGASYISTPEQGATAVDAVLQLLGERDADFDAAVIASSSDSGLDAAEGATPKPVTAMTKAALTIAARTGSRIGFLCFQELGLALMPELAARYGLDAHLAGVRLAARLEGGVAPDGEDLMRAILAAGELAIAEDGADVLIVGGAAAAVQTAELSRQLGVPVLDGTRAAVQVMEEAVR